MSGEAESVPAGALRREEGCLYLGEECLAGCCQDLQPADPSIVWEVWGALQGACPMIPEGRNLPYGSESDLSGRKVWWQPSET
jgi:hypothetical protein